MAFDWNSVQDPGGIANNRPRGSTGAGYFLNNTYDVIKGKVVLPGGVLAIGDVWTFNSPTTAPFVNGSSYTVTGVTIYTTATTTIGGVTFTVGPDLVTLSGVTTISVDWLTGNFTRTTAASPVSPYGNQIPAHV
jgi:hypothetical protein